jgi:tripartite-type tricarboxylate transporter receptor subunit TctC
VDNKAGAGTVIGADALARAPADGYTILVSSNTTFTLNPALRAKLPYDPQKSFEGVGMIGSSPLVLLANPKVAASTVAQVVAAAKAQPGKLNWAATPGLPVYALLALQRATGTAMANVPYRDFAPAYQDLNQGRLHVIGTGVPTQVAHHRAGTAKLLFVTNRERSPQVPDVPTAKEAGFPDLTFEGVAGVYGWRGMPADIRQRVVDDVATIVADLDFRGRVLKVGTVPRTGTPEEFAAAITAQRDQVAAIHAATAKPRP